MRYIREALKRFCTWELAEYGWETECGETYPFIFRSMVLNGGEKQDNCINNEEPGHKLCPYCGRVIRVRTDWNKQEEI